MLSVNSYSRYFRTIIWCPVFAVTSRSASRKISTRS